MGVGKVQVFCMDLYCVFLLSVRFWVFLDGGSVKKGRLTFVARFGWGWGVCWGRDWGGGGGGACPLRNKCRSEALVEQTDWIFEIRTVIRVMYPWRKWMVL